MSLEQEIKLVVTGPQTRLDLNMLANLLDDVVSGPEQNDLVSTYFDTPDFALKEFGVGLRLRRVNTQWLQTVKCSGHAVAGLHQRKEWEHPLAAAAFDLDLLRQTELAPLVDDATVWPRLVALFTTDFQRTQWLVRLDDETLVELAYDFGLVKAGDKQSRIHEVELELKQGSLKKMQAFSQQLKAALPLVFSDISKAAQGYSMFISC